MIDEKIINSLKELEQGLKDIESARKQVEKIVNSYEGLSRTTGEYVTRLGDLTTKVQNLVGSIGKDYEQNVKAFEIDRETIVNASNEASEKLSAATLEFKDSLSVLKAKVNAITEAIDNLTSATVEIKDFLPELMTKLKYNLILNFLSLAAIIVTIILLLIK